MGCQREIASQVVSQGADYILALKGNQAILQEAVRLSLRHAEKVTFRGIGHDHARATG